MNFMADSKNIELATFGNGCFWCTEAVFQQLKGVEKVTSGYSGGHVENPTYEQVCGKKTGHVEVLRIEYDPAIISFDELLEVFWATHDPTTLNRQGNDSGPQYRSVIFYHNDYQEEKAEKYKAAHDKKAALLINQLLLPSSLSLIFTKPKTTTGITTKIIVHNPIVILL